MPGGGAATTLMTLDYDPRRQRYVGTWVGSMMIHMWVYEGHLDDSGKVLAPDCEGEDFEQPGRMARYQDIITVTSPAHRPRPAPLQSPDRHWQTYSQPETR